MDLGLSSLLIQLSLGLGSFLRGDFLASLFQIPVIQDFAAQIADLLLQRVDTSLQGRDLLVGDAKEPLQLRHCIFLVDFWRVFDIPRTGTKS